MTGKWVTLGETELGSNAASVTFGSLQPSTGTSGTHYDTIRVMWSANTSWANYYDELALGINASTYGWYYTELLWCTGSQPYYVNTSGQNRSNKQYMVGALMGGNSGNSASSHGGGYIDLFGCFNNGTSVNDRIGFGSQSFAPSTDGHGGYKATWSGGSGDKAAWGNNIYEIQIRTGSGSDLKSGSLFSVYGLRNEVTT
jgi:hypothetical protein